MALFLYEKSDVMRHLGFEAQGLYQTSPAGGSAAYGNTGFRYFGAYGQALYRLNQLAPDEECRVAGRAYGSIGFSGVAATPGDTVTVTLSGTFAGSPISETYTVPPLGTLQGICAGLAQLFSQNAAFVNAGFFATADYGSQPFTQSRVQLPIVSFIGAPTLQSFNIAVAFTGISAPQIIAQGLMLPPFLSIRQVGQINKVFGYLPILDYLEAAWLGSTSQQSVNVTDNVHFRHDEMEQREDLYNKWRERFATWLLGGRQHGNTGSGPMQVVV